MSNLPTISDYQTAIAAPLCVKAAALQGGKPFLFRGSPMLYAGGFCVVFPFETASKKKVAVRCWTASVENAEHRSEEIARTLNGLTLPFFLEFSYIPAALLTSIGIQPVVCMQWVEATTLKTFIDQNIHNPDALKSAANSFLDIVKTLHLHQLSHGDLQHDNILVKGDGSLVLVDYDGMYVPSLQGERDDIKGLKGYQHPKRQENKLLTPKADYFSELVIYLSLLALAAMPNLWEAGKMRDTDTLLFSEQDLLAPAGSRMFALLASCPVDTVRKLANEVRKACGEADILSLHPLETVLADINRMPWEGKEPKPLPPVPTIDTTAISNKFSSNAPPTRKPDLDVSSIISKF